MFKRERNQNPIYAAQLPFPTYDLIQLMCKIVSCAQRSCHYFISEITVHCSRLKEKKKCKEGTDRIIKFAINTGVMMTGENIEGKF